MKDNPSLFTWIHGGMGEMKSEDMLLYLSSQFQPFASNDLYYFSVLREQHIKHLLENIFLYLFVDVVDVQSLRRWNVHLESKK